MNQLVTLNESGFMNSLNFHPQAMFTTLGVSKVTEIFISEGII